VVRVGSQPAHVAAASRSWLRFYVPHASESGLLPVFVGDEAVPRGSITVAYSLTAGLHQVDNPAVDDAGRIYVTHSGGRGVKVPVPIYRVTRGGIREPLAVDIANPTSIALGPDGAMYVSSRFEGQVYRLAANDEVELFAGELGVPTGLAFSPDGALYVGDRSGSIFKVTDGPNVETFATLPASIAAFHLAFGPDRCLYVAAPTLASHDAIYRITPDRLVDVVSDRFGRPQGLAFDSRGHLYVADSLAGSSGLYRLDLTQANPRPELVVSAPAVVGVAVDPEGGLLLASNDALWRLDGDVWPPGSGIAPAG
jgi:sugar lactone lactonase YvrE